MPDPINSIKDMAKRTLCVHLRHILFGGFIYHCMKEEEKHML